MWSCWRVKVAGLEATKTLTSHTFRPVTAVARKVGCTEEPGARLCPTPPVDLSLFSSLSFQHSDKACAAQIPAKTRSMSHVRQALSMNDNAIQPLFPEDPASLDPRVLAGSFGQRYRRSPRAKSMVLSAQTKATKSTAQRSMTLVLTKGDKLTDPELPLKGASGAPAAKHHRSKVMLLASLLRGCVL